MKAEIYGWIEKGQRTTILKLYHVTREKVARIISTDKSIQIATSIQHQRHSYYVALVRLRKDRNKRWWKFYDDEAQGDQDIWTLEKFPLNKGGLKAKRMALFEKQNRRTWWDFYSNSRSTNNKCHRASRRICSLAVLGKDCESIITNEAQPSHPDCHVWRIHWSYRACHPI